MMDDAPNFEITIPISEGSKVWHVLEKEIPRGADLQSANLLLTPQRASVTLYYIGRKADGEMHKRTSVQSVTIRTNLGNVYEFLVDAFDEVWASRLLPFVD